MSKSCSAADSGVRAVQQGRKIVMGKTIVIFAILVVIGASSTRAEEPRVAEVKGLGKVQSTSVKSQPIKIDNLDELKAASQIYWVMLINSTDHMVTMVRVNKG